MKLLFCAVALILACTTASLVAAPHAYADQNPAPTSVGLSNYSTFTVGTSTAYQILPRNTNRAGLIVQNNGAVSIVIKPGSVPANATDGIVLIAGAIWEPSPPPVDALFGWSASSTAKVIMIENIK